LGLAQAGRRVDEDMGAELEPEDSRRLRSLFERAADLPHAEHAAFVERECGPNVALRELLAFGAEKKPYSWFRYNSMSQLGEALLGQGEYAEIERLLLEGHEKMRPPAGYAFRKTQALARIVKLYESWGKQDKA
jgi:hypothetical protein